MPIVSAKAWATPTPEERARVDLLSNAVIAAMHAQPPVRKGERTFTYNSESHQKHATVGCPEPRSLSMRERTFFRAEWTEEGPNGWETVEWHDHAYDQNTLQFTARFI